MTPLKLKYVVREGRFMRQKGNGGLIRSITRGVVDLAFFIVVPLLEDCQGHVRA